MRGRAFWVVFSESGLGGREYYVGGFLGSALVSTPSQNVKLVSSQEEGRGREKQQLRVVELLCNLSRPS